MTAAGGHAAPPRCLGNTPQSRAEGECGEEKQIRGPLVRSGDERGGEEGNGAVGTGADGGRGESKRVHAAAAPAKAAARLAHEQATRRAAEDDLGVWRKVHWQAENYSTVPAVKIYLHTNTECAMSHSTRIIQRSCESDRVRSRFTKPNADNPGFFTSPID